MTRKPGDGRPRRGRLLAALAAAYLVGLHAAAGVMLAKSNFLHLAGKTLGLVQPEEFGPEYFEKAVALARRDAAVPDGAVLLLGDSMVEQLPAGIVDHRAVGLGVGGDTVRGLMHRLPLHRSAGRAGALVLAIGVNDLKYRDPAEIAAEYAQLLAMVPSGPGIHVGAVLPVDEGNPMVASRPWLRNERIRALNRGIEEACRSHPGCTFVDTWQGMARGSRGLDPAYAGPDGWHLSAEGQRVWARLLAGSLATGTGRPAEG
ncbi:GDSL-type esterase/lipase family protein [Arenibaculum pallidiluteum]|uniref:GDSL-type esterase/lipase family protein n=1 Tax=Arenibaculum pallidiluteum TaxID=2812559 RepID=UPI001A9744EE|nr:GDSL-type esterase/lipase family protein [Arenibaculum pallidiluteum]